MNKEQYLILMNIESDKLSPYKGAITIINGIPWHCTGLSIPTLFNSDRSAQKQAEGLLTRYPNFTFDVIPKTMYLSLIDKDWRCPWLQSLRQEQQDLFSEKTSQQ